MGEIAKADADFTTAIEDRDTERDALFHSIHGDFLLDVGRKEEGIAELRNAVRFESENVEYYAGLAEGFLFVEQYNDVIDVVNQINKLSTDNHDAQSFKNLASMFEAISLACTNRDYREARKRFEVSLKPTKVDWSFNLLDKWVNASRCPDRAKLLAKEMIDSKKRVVR